MNSSVVVSLAMEDAQKLLRNRGLDNGGHAQQYAVNQLIGVFDGYVPLRAGVLKGSAHRDFTTTGATGMVIVYNTPYAKRMYYGTNYKFNEAPKRGALWDKRAWVDHKDTFLNDLENYLNSRRGVLD